MISPVKTSIPLPEQHFYDPDHNVIKLKYEKWEEFTELIISHLTRLLDLPGDQLETLRGDCESVLRDTGNKLHLSAKKSWNPLKKKDSKYSALSSSLTDESLSQIQQLTDFLGKHLSVEGLFRKPGNSIRQNQLVTALSTGVYIDFDKSQFQAHDVACVLKTYLGQLSEPLLLPSKHFNAHVQIANMMQQDDNGEEIPNKGKRIETLQLLLLLLPTAHRKVLRGILNLLYQTARHQSENKMNAANLAAMFTPHLIWPRHVKASDIHESVAKLNNHVAFLIRHSQKILIAPFYIREAANVYFPETKTQFLSPKVSTTFLVAPSSAIKRTASERLRYTDKAKAETENAMSNLYDQVSLMPNSAKKKKIVKNFTKHQEVIKYNSKNRKRHRTLSGMLRRKNLIASAVKPRPKDSYHSFPQPEEEMPNLSQHGLKLPKPDLLNDCNAETRSLNADVKFSCTSKTSHASLPGNIQNKVEVRSPRLTALSKQFRLRQTKKAFSPSLASKENQSHKSPMKYAKVSTV
ncbi:rho GTPase-activating protein 19 [Ciona intestinalis]